MADQFGLFTGEPSSLPTLPHKGGKPSRGYLVKLRLEQGRHPHRGDALGPAGETCGTCVHLRHQGGVAGRYLKCAHGPSTRGPATDIRAKWPSCALWKAAEVKRG